MIKIWYDDRRYFITEISMLISILSEQLKLS